MKAHLLVRCGKHGSLLLADVPDPQVGNDDLLIEVPTASLNPLGSKIRDGAFKPLLPYKTPRLRDPLPC
jgi:NADPH:quinone reductase-like Zn-dependent oxidoreductase